MPTFARQWQEEDSSACLLGGYWLPFTDWGRGGRSGGSGPVAPPGPTPGLSCGSGLYLYFRFPV